MKFPKHQIQEVLRDDGSVQFLAQSKVGPLSVNWDDQPQNWVTNKWFEHRRIFLNGPFKKLNALFQIEPLQQGCIGKYTITFESANLLGQLLLIGPTQKRMELLFNKQISYAKDYLKKNREQYL